MGLVVKALHSRGVQQCRCATGLSQLRCETAVTTMKHLKASASGKCPGEPSYPSPFHPHIKGGFCCKLKNPCFRYLWNEKSEKWAVPQAAKLMKPDVFPVWPKDPQISLQYNTHSTPKNSISPEHHQLPPVLPSSLAEQQAAFCLLAAEAGCVLADHCPPG